MDELKTPPSSKLFARGIRPQWKSRKASASVGWNVAVPSLDEHLPKSPIAEAISAAECRTAPLHILVADDNAVNRQLVRRILEKENFQVALASTGTEALTALLEASFDLVIMDVQMPEMDGLQATAAIRSGMVKGINAALPVIAVSANSFPEDRQRCLQAGMNTFVAKPVSASELLAAVRKYGNLVPFDAPAPVVDWQTSLDRLGDPDLVELVCVAFLRDTPQLLCVLEKAVAEGALGEVERYAHSLKGYAANVGAESLRRAALDMETAAERGNAGNLQRLLASVNGLAGNVLEILGKG